MTIVEQPMRSASHEADVVMPRLTDSMEEGIVVRWLKSVGDAVEPGEPLAEIETDRSTLVYEADTGGTLLTMVAAPSDAFPIGATIATVGLGGGKGAAKRMRASPTETKRLAGRVRDGSIAPAELEGTTFTVSNLGTLGVEELTAAITPRRPPSSSWAPCGACSSPATTARPRS